MSIEGKMQEFYLLHYSKAPKTVLFSPLDIRNLKLKFIDIHNFDWAISTIHNDLMLQWKLTYQ